MGRPFNKTLVFLLFSQTIHNSQGSGYDKINEKISFI